MSSLSNWVIPILLCFWNAWAAAAAPAVPNLFNDAPSLTVPQIVLGRSCYSLRASYLDLDCNPAFLAGEEKILFRANIVGNDRLNLVNNYRKQLNNDDTVGVAESLLQQNSQVIAKAASSFWYQHEWWAIGLVPVRAGVAYLRRNPAYPEISVNAYKELELFGKVGLFSSEDENLRVGLQTRYVNRDYIYQRFYALDAVTDPTLVKLRHQSALYLEPAMAYSWNAEWKPEVSWTVANLAVAQEGDHLPMQPIFDIGFSSNFLEIEGFRSTTHYAYNKNNPDMITALTWSGVYDYEDLFSTYLTLGKSLFGLGAEARWYALTFGVCYRTEQVLVDRWVAHTISSFTFDLGLVF